MEDFNGMQQRRSDAAPPQNGNIPGTDNFFNVENNNMAAQFAKAGMEQYLGANVSQLQNKMNKYIAPGQLKYYFNVDNQFVLNKLRNVLLPYLHKDWHRQESEQFENNPSPYARFLPPRMDLNAPDLYIPTMAFITYILLVGLALGTSDRFAPETLGVTSTSGLILLGLEILLTKLGVFFLNSSEKFPFLDLLAYAGYKYVGVVLNFMLGLAFGSTLYYVTLAFTSSSCAFFMYKTFGQRLPTPILQSMKKQYFLIGVSAVQIPMMLLMGYNILEFK